jgi:serine/threonine-protein kinase
MVEDGLVTDPIDIIDAGANDVVEKPVQLRELRTRLAAGLRGRKLTMSTFPSQRNVVARDPEQALLGRVIAGKYQIDGIIGHGGMGMVCRGIHLTLGTRVAIKFIKSEYVKNPIARARFELEAKSAARLRTRYAVQVFDYGVTEDGLPYIVMEHLEGPSLLQRVSRGGPMSFAETVTMIVQSAHALGQCHAHGMIHRDVKPDNVLLVNDPDQTSSRPAIIAKLIDFGVAKVLVNLVDGACEGEITTQSGAVVGTPNFMSPEQLRGTVAPNPAADLWALAACAFTAITGRIPFEGLTFSDVVIKVCKEPLPVPSQLNPAVPKEFDAWFARACDPRPSARFRTARELATALATAYRAWAHEDIDATPSLSRFATLAPKSGIVRDETTLGARLFTLDEPLLAQA